MVFKDISIHNVCTDKEDHKDIYAIINYIINYNIFSTFLV